MGAFDNFSSAFAGQLASGLGGGVASAAGGLIGGIVSGINARSNMRRQQRYNKELLKLQNDYATAQADASYEREKDFYNIQNAYNNPSAVRERYEAAGINVNSAFGTSGSYTPNQSSPSVPQADTISPPYQNADVTFGDPLEAAYKMAMINNINAQTEKTKGETPDSDETLRGQRLANDLLEQGVISKELANKQAQFDYDFAFDTRDLNIKNLKQRTSNLEAQYLNMAAEYEKTRAQAALSQEQARSIASIIELNGARVGYYKAMTRRADSDTDLNAFRKRVYISEADLNDSKSLLSFFQSLTEAEKPENIRANTEYINAKKEIEQCLKDVEQAKLELEKELQSYRKWNMATQSAKNFTGAIDNFTHSAKNVADSMEKIVSLLGKIALLK